MIIIDGKKIAEEIYEDIKSEVEKMQRKPKLAIVTCAPNFETQKYLALKKKKAESVGIGLTVIELAKNASTEEAIASVERIAVEADGVVVQLPLPTQIAADEVLAVVPADMDPDCFAGAVDVLLPPVVGAINEIAQRYGISWENKRVAVIGYGRLVGKPAASYATKKGAIVSVLTEESEDFETTIQSADIIISGAGRSGLVKKEMVKEGVAVFDAGTSEDGGELKGDVAQDVAEKASLYTPVPGGIGPITVAVLLRNLVALSTQ